MDTTTRTYSIREVALLTGLPASTLRYYESVGVTPRVGRGRTSGHRVYTQDDLDLLSWVSCLAATGMPVEQMRAYVANGRSGRGGAGDQVALLAAQDERLAEEERQIAIRRRYLRLKIDFWQALGSGDDERAQRLGEAASALADELRSPRRQTGDA